VLVRPHPAHAPQWSDVSLAEFGNVSIWPLAGAAPLDAERKQDYYDSLFHAACVVGVNTSGFLEAGILGRRTLSVRSPEFPQSQEGTLHFRYLTSAGLVSLADEIVPHLAELANVLRGEGAASGKIDCFIEEFLRPNGLATPCTPILASALERLAADKQREPLAPPFAAPLVRGLTFPVALLVRRFYLGRIARRPERVNIVPPPARKADKEEARAKL
jgi:hypothetical protein